MNTRSRHSLSIGEGWIAEEAFAMAVYCVLKYPDDYQKCIQLAVNVTGDSDSIGCLAGGIVGARVGYEMINEELVNNLREGRILKDFVKPLLKMRNMLENSLI